MGIQTSFSIKVAVNINLQCSFTRMRKPCMYSRWWPDKDGASGWLWKSPVLSYKGKLSYQQAWCTCTTFQWLCSFCCHPAMLDSIAGSQSHTLPWPLSHHRQLFVLLSWVEAFASTWGSTASTRSHRTSERSVEHSMSCANEIGKMLAT